jgi:calcium binding protein 39
MIELNKSVKEMKVILYGNGEEDPCDEACKKLTKEFFKKDTDIFRHLITCLPQLDLEVSQTYLCFQNIVIDSF